MDIEQLKRFVAVAELHSFSRAAELLGLSQPSLTRSIRLLEEGLETRLFIRGPRDILLTAAGEELLPHARVILVERDRAIASIHASDPAVERLSIGTDNMLSERLPRALAQLATSHPQIRIRIVDGTFEEILTMVREGSVDFVLGACAPRLDLSGLVFEPFSIERASVLVRADHPLLAHGTVSREDLLRAQWIVPDQSTIIEGWSQIFREWNLPVPPIALHAASASMIRNCLLHGDFVSIGDYAAYAAEIEAGLLIELDLQMPRYERPVGLFHRENVRLSDNAIAFARTLRDVCERDARASGEV